MHSVYSLFTTLIQHCTVHTRLLRYHICIYCTHSPSTLPLSYYTVHTRHVLHHVCTYRTHSPSTLPFKHCTMHILYITHPCRPCLLLLGRGKRRPRQIRHRSIKQDWRSKGRSFFNYCMYIPSLQHSQVRHSIKYLTFHPEWCFHFARYLSSPILTSPLLTSSLLPSALLTTSPPTKPCTKATSRYNSHRHTETRRDGTTAACSGRRSQYHQHIPISQGRRRDGRGHGQ